MIAPPSIQAHLNLCHRKQPDVPTKEMATQQQNNINGMSLLFFFLLFLATIPLHSQLTHDQSFPILGGLLIYGDIF